MSGIEVERASWALYKATEGAATITSVDRHEGVITLADDNELFEVGMRVTVSPRKPFLSRLRDAWRVLRGVA